MKGLTKCRSLGIRIYGEEISNAIANASSVWHIDKIVLRDGTGAGYCFFSIQSVSRVYLPIGYQIHTYCSGGVACLQQHSSNKESHCCSSEHLGGVRERSAFSFKKIIPKLCKGEETVKCWGVSSIHNSRTAYPSFIIHTNRRTQCTEYWNRKQKWVQSIIADTRSWNSK